MNQSKPFPITTGFFAMPLGLGALSLAWLNAEEIYIYAKQIGNAIGLVSIILWATLIGCYIYRTIFYFEQIKAEFLHPVQCSLFSLVTMTTMITGDILYLWDMSFGKSLIFLGVAVHLIFLILVIGRLWNGTQFLPDTLHPVHYLPPIAACFTMASSFGLIGLNDIGSLFRYWYSFLVSSRANNVATNEAKSFISYCSSIIRDCSCSLFCWLGSLSRHWWRS